MEDNLYFQVTCKLEKDRVKMRDKREIRNRMKSMKKYNSRELLCWMLTALPVSLMFARPPNTAVWLLLWAVCTFLLALGGRVMIHLILSRSSSKGRRTINWEQEEAEEQFFYRNSFASKGVSYETEMLYSYILEVSETEDDFVIQLKNQRILYVSKKDFVKGNPKDFLPFIQKAAKEITFTQEADRMDGLWADHEAGCNFRFTTAETEEMYYHLYASDSSSVLAPQRRGIRVWIYFLFITVLAASFLFMKCEIGYRLILFFIIGAAGALAYWIPCKLCLSKHYAGKMLRKRAKEIWKARKKDLKDGEERVFLFKEEHYMEIHHDGGRLKCQYSNIVRMNETQCYIFLYDKAFVYPLDKMRIELGSIEMFKIFIEAHTKKMIAEQPV